MKTGKRLWGFLNLQFALALLVAIIGHASPAFAQMPGTFAPTGNMTTAREGHTATLLPNGKVLIAGGWQSVPGAQNCKGHLHVRDYFLECVLLLTSAELYDPLTGTFAATGNMTTARLFHTATLLPNGNVLIEGSSAELYDPSTGTFTAINNMNTGGNTATLLSNGKVLLTSLPARLYDPANGTFLDTGAYAGTGGSFVTATLLPNRKVLIAAGPDCCPSPGRTELYDPGAGTFSLTAPIFTLSESSFTATLLTNGKVLVAGGDFVGGDDTYPISAGEYDPSTGTFTATGNMTTARRDQTATLLPDGTVLIAGGDFAAGTSAELYKFATGTFSGTGNMTTPRFSHTATLLLDGRVLITGGLPYSTATTSSAELYHPAAVQGTPTVRIMDNDTGSLTTLAVGDSFSFLVTGALPSSLVFVSEPGWSSPIGYTDSSGSFRLSGIVGPDVIGTWQQTWTIGGVVAQPGPLQFTITPKP